MDTARKRAEARATTILLQLFGIPGIGRLTVDESRQAEQLIADEIEHIVANGLDVDWHYAVPAHPLWDDAGLTEIASGIIDLRY